MDNFFRVTKDTPNYQSQYYTVIGQHDFIDNDDNPSLNSADDNKLMAEKITYTDGRQAFYVRVGTYGKLYNPIGMYSEGRLKKYMAKFGKKEWTLKKVNPKVFQLYVSFLKTKNVAWFNNAEREME